MGDFQFELIKKSVFDCYGKCKYEKALDFAKLAAENFPDKMSQTSYWLACLYSRLEQNNNAIYVLKQAMGKNLWWSPSRLLADEDLFLLHSLDGFIEILRVCQEREEIAKAITKPKLEIHKPKSYHNKGMYPLLISLHWQNGNVVEYADYWKNRNALEDYILAFPQSSQISATEEYHWNNEILAAKEVQESYNKIISQYPINRDKMLISGVSQGGKLAIQLALKNQEQFYKGFIAVIPIVSQEEIEALVPIIHSAAVKGVRGCIIAGERDIHCENALKLHQAFINHQFPCKLIMTNSIGHQMPDNFSKKLKSAIRYVL